MTNYKPIDVSKEDFRKYLERTGVLDAMTQMLIKCNTARPANPIEYMKANLGDPKQDSDEVTNLKAELQSARAEIERLTMEISMLKHGTPEGRRSSSDLGLDTTEVHETAPQNSANGADTDSPTAEAEETAVPASVASPVITKQGKENETKAVDVAATEVQNGLTMEKPDEKEKEGSTMN